MFSSHPSSCTEKARLLRGELLNREYMDDLIHHNPHLYF